MAIRTIFTMVEDCIRGELLGWQEFIRTYAPIAGSLLDHYFPTTQPDRDAHVTRIFQRGRENGSAWFAGLHFTNEREFLMYFRELVFAYARAVARVPAPEVSVDQTRELLRDLSVVHLELLWMFIKGYSATETADILMNADSTATAVSQQAPERIAQLVPGGVSGGAARALLEAAANARTPECLALKTFNNLVNGQLSWQERDAAERHIGDCLHCLDRFTSFQEMIWYGRHAQPLDDGSVQPILAALPLSPKRKGLVGRLFSKSA